jgi:hypothetical protein
MNYHESINYAFNNHVVLLILQYTTLWRSNPLLGKNFDMNNETTAASI